MSDFQHPSVTITVQVEGAWDAQVFTAVAIQPQLGRPIRAMVALPPVDGRSR